jgi:hypothetical protein
MNLFALYGFVTEKNHLFSVAFPRPASKKRGVKFWLIGKSTVKYGLQDANLIEMVEVEKNRQNLFQNSWFICKN